MWWWWAKLVDSYPSLIWEIFSYYASELAMSHREIVEPKATRCNFAVLWRRQERRIDGVAGKIVRNAKYGSPPYKSESSQPFSRIGLKSA